MNLGLRALLLIAAVVPFVAWGLACLAGALLVGETGFARIGGRR